MMTILKRTLAVGFAGALAATAASPAFAQRVRDLGPAGAGFVAGAIVGSTIASPWGAYAFAPGPAVVEEPGDAYAAAPDAVIIEPGEPSAGSPSLNYADQLSHRERELRGID